MYPRIKLKCNKTWPTNAIGKQAKSTNNKKALLTLDQSIGT